MGDEIQKNHFYLSKHLSNLKEVLSCLIQHAAISTDEQEDIEAERTSVGKNMKLLSTLEKKDWTRVRDLFVEILRNTNNGHCADKIEGIKTKTNFNKAKILKDKWWPGKQVLEKPFHLQDLELLLQQLHEEIVENVNRMVCITETSETWKYFPSGGAGKTLWAKWYAHTHEKHYDHILWIDCGDNSVLTSFKKLAIDVNVKERNELQDAEDYARKSYSQLEEWKCLWIFDNVQNYQEMMKVLPKYKENFYCLMTSRRNERVDKWGYLQISELELDIVGDKQSCHLFKFMGDKLKTKKAKFNYALFLYKNGYVKECLSIVDKIFEKIQTDSNEFTEAVELIFASLPKDKIITNEIKIQFVDLTKEASEVEVGALLLYSHLQLANYQQASTIAKQIVTDIGHLIELLSITQITNYQLNAIKNEVDLQLGVKTNEISLRLCPLPLRFLDRLCPRELILDQVSFFRDGRELGEVKVNDFVDLTKIKRLIINCDEKKKNVSLDLSEEIICMEFLYLNSVGVLNWNISNWNITELQLAGIPFEETTNIEVQEMTLHNSSCDVSCLPETIQKLTLDGVKLFVSGVIELPNLNRLTMGWMEDIGCLSHFRSAPLTHIHLNRIKEVELDLLPETLTHLQITEKENTRVVGGMRRMDKVILNNFPYKKAEECLSHFQTDNLVFYYYDGIEAKELEQLIKKKINTIAVGKIKWIKAEFMELVFALQLISEFLFLEGGSGRAIPKVEFEDKMKLF